MNDELICALKDINKNAVERNFEKFNTTVQQGGMIKKHLSYTISSGCPYNVSDDINWVVDIAFGANNKTSPYFLSTTKIKNYSGAQLMRVVNDGTVFIETKENRVHNLWMSKTISLDGGGRLQAQATSEGSDAAFKVLESYSQKNYVAHTIKINNGIYIVDFLGGIVVSFN